MGRLVAFGTLLLSVACGGEEQPAGPDTTQPVVASVEVSPMEQTFTAIETAWHRYAVLIFEEQTLTDDQHLAFSRRFGRLERGLMMSSKRLLAHLSNAMRATYSVKTSMQAGRCSND